MRYNPGMAAVTHESDVAVIGGGPAGAGRPGSCASFEPALGQEGANPMRMILRPIKGMVLSFNSSTGNYTFSIVATPHLAFADGNVGPNDITAVGTDTLQQP